MSAQLKNSGISFDVSALLTCFKVIFIFFSTRERAIRHLVLFECLFKSQHLFSLKLIYKCTRRELEQTGPRLSVNNCPLLIASTGWQHWATLLTLSYLQTQTCGCLLDLCRSSNRTLQKNVWTHRAECLLMNLKKIYTQLKTKQRHDI